VQKYLMLKSDVSHYKSTSYNYAQINSRCAECRPSGGREINPFRDGKPAHKRKRPGALKTRESPRSRPGKAHSNERARLATDNRYRASLFLL